MNKLFVQVERVTDLKGRADNYFGFDLCGKDAADATAFAYAEKCKPQTNADKLRAMTDEELAEWIGKVTAGGYGMCAPGHYDCTGKNSCAPCWLDWLRQEADDDGN